MKRISILCPYPIGLAPSQRFRIEQYLDEKIPADFRFSIKPFFSESAYNNLYLPGKTFYKFIQVFLGFVKRIAHCFSALPSDYILVHREASPLGPPIFEWLLARVFRKKIIFDFDDAIWLPNTSDQNKLSADFKWHHKFNSICKWSYKIAAGNDFLVSKALQFNKNVILIPTVVDTENSYLPMKKRRDNVTIGWTGSHSTAPFLKTILPLLKNLHSEYPFRFLFISNQKPDFDLSFLEYRKWNRETEIEDLCEMDIGIMPLPVNDWARGKCGFKLIQYLALEIPAVSTDIPPNDKILIHNQNGFLCQNDSEWLSHLKTLLENEEYRNQFGKKGREHIIENYSKKTYRDMFFKQFS